MDTKKTVPESLLANPAYFSGYEFKSYYPKNIYVETRKKDPAGIITEQKDIGKVPSSIARTSIRRTKISRPTWNDFIQDTTFHGIKYVFAPNYMLLRRFIWVLLVLTAVVLFTFQVVDRTLDYLKHRSTVNVELVHTDRLDFPAVTICNQNNYRITKTEELGIYSFINEVYSELSFEVEPPDKIGGFNVTQVTLAAGHQVEDFITRCTWRGKPCNVSRDFKLTLTRFGVCYTFNGETDPLQVTQSGAGFGLNLILNIEQYEYMKGPQDEAGVKVLLHDQNEAPLVKDLGFAVAPGTHTLVGVHRTQVSNLPSPYGRCRPGAPPMSNCTLHCRTREIASRCHCRESFFPSDSSGETPLCNMSNTFTCVLRRWYTMTEQDLKCQCALPCQRVTYEPVLSYAHLSKLSIDRISLADPKKAAKVKADYQHAREVAHRVDRNHAIHNMRLIEALLTKASSYHNNISFFLDMLGGPDNSNSTSTVIMDETYGILASDLDTIKRAYKDKNRNARREFPSLKETTRMYSIVKNSLHLSDGESRHRLQLQRCADLAEKQVTTTVPTTTPAAGDMQNPYSDYYVCTVSSKTLNYFYRGRNIINLTSKYMKSAVKELDNLHNSYIHKVENLFGGTSFRYENLSDHVTCNNLLSNLNDTWREEFNRGQAAIDLYLNTSNYLWTPKVKALDELMLFYDWLKSNDSVLDMDRYNACSWIIPEVVGGSSKDVTYRKYTDHSESAVKSSADASGLLEPLRSCLVSHISSIDNAMDSLQGTLEQFLAKKRSKAQLNDYFMSDSVQHALTRISESDEQCRNIAQHFAGKVRDIETNLLQLFSAAADFKPPALEDALLNKLHLVMYARKTADYSGDVILENILFNMTSQREGVLLRLTERLYGDYGRTLREQIAIIGQQFTAIMQALSALQMDLEEFVRGNRIDEKFFMENYIKMDIFYSALSFEHITQHVAFEFLSLLSEVGGFLGLLLGASVLTVFELLDYLALSTLHKCRMIGQHMK